GSLGPLNVTLVNPYSGETVELAGSYNVSPQSFDGAGGSDTLFLTNLNDVVRLNDGSGNPTLASVETIICSSGDDVIILADAVLTYPTVTLFGNVGSDIIWSNAGDDIIHGLSGDDRLHGGPGNDTIYGGNNNDWI